MKKLTFPIYEFRPDAVYSGRLLRYNNGNWITDDGEYGLAFVSLDDPIYYYVSLPYYDNILWSWCKGGNWTAKVREHPDYNAWHYMYKNNIKSHGNSWNRGNHPNELIGRVAGNVCASRYGCANGRGIEFNVHDKTINAKLLRIVETKKIVKIPKIFTCTYCGNHDWKKEEKEK